jgi:oligoribonuclease
MEDAASSPLIWLDMEMTGLEPLTCVPLQIAVVITDSRLEELDAGEVTIWQSEETLARMEPFVRRMHTDNGLLERVRASEFSVVQAEREMMTLVSRWCPFGTGILAGNSIHTDRAFIKAYFPTLHGYLHYRMVDVSSIKEMARRWYGRDALFVKELQQHTALEDARESIAELRHYRATLMAPIPNP